ncbi:TPA: hypothetical protein NJ081_004557 [Vibrio parahaemolyticus]|nr:hypothetical protein [Vibrio parahaemolyticus]
MKVRLPFSCKYGQFKQDEDVTDQRVIEEYTAYFYPELETKPDPVVLETKPVPKKRTRKPKKAQ